MKTPSTDNFHPIFKEETAPISSRKQIRREHTLPKPFYRTSIILIPNPFKDSTRKILATSLTSIDAKSSAKH